MKRKKLILLLMIFLLLASAALLKGEGKFSGLMFGDYYYVLAHHDEAVENNNGFWLRRIYFTYDNTLTDKIAMRFRLEMNSPGDFKTSTTLIPFVKDAYLTAKIGKHTLMLGLIGTPLYDTLDEYWGYRPMEKTPIDLFKFGNSREFGVGLKGALDAKNKLTYTVVFGNGAGLKSETDRGKAVYGRLNFQPTPSLFLEALRRLHRHGQRQLGQHPAGLRRREGRLGPERPQLRAAQRQAGRESSSDLKFISLFGVFKISPKLDLVGRYDRLLDPNPNGSKIDYIPMANNAKANVRAGRARLVAERQREDHPQPQVCFLRRPGKRREARGRSLRLSHPVFQILSAPRTGEPGSPVPASLHPFFPRGWNWS